MFTAFTILCIQLSDTNTNNTGGQQRTLQPVFHDFPGLYKP